MADVFRRWIRPDQRWSNHQCLALFLSIEQRTKDTFNESFNYTQRPELFTRHPILFRLLGGRWTHLGLLCSQRSQS